MTLAQFYLNPLQSSQQLSKIARITDQAIKAVWLSRLMWRYMTFHRNLFTCALQLILLAMPCLASEVSDFQLGGCPNLARDGKSPISATDLEALRQATVSRLTIYFRRNYMKLHCNWGVPKYSTLVIVVFTI
jgi:hypothetical protein